MNSYLKYSLKLEILYVLRIEVIVNSTTCSLRLVYCLSFFPYDLQDKSWTHSQLVFFLLSLASVLRPWQTIRYVTSVIQRWRLTFNPRRWTPVDLGSILWANQRTIIYHAPDPPPLTRPCSLIFFFFLQQLFLLPFARSELTLKISFIELKSKRLRQRLFKKFEKG